MLVKSVDWQLQNRPRQSCNSTVKFCHCMSCIIFVKKLFWCFAVQLVNVTLCSARPLQGGGFKTCMLSYMFSIHIVWYVSFSHLNVTCSPLWMTAFMFRQIYSLLQIDPRNKCRIMCYSISWDLPVWHVSIIVENIWTL